MAHDEIIIQTNADFTPAGKRRCRLVKLRGQFGPVSRIRWYVGNMIYNTLPPTNENYELSRKWIAAQS